MGGLLNQYFPSPSGEARQLSPVTALDITLQLNLCAGDLAYAEETVPALVATHRPDVREVLIVADACHPQSTPVLHSPSRFPAAGFAERVARLRALCARWQSEGLVDRVEFLEPQSARVRELNRKYSGRATPWTHDHLGHAFSAYFAGWESARTRYVLHFDADILLHQATGFSWLQAAVAVLESESKVLAVSPRIAPPLPGAGELRMVRPGEPGCGWVSSWRLTPDSRGWRSDWFSTRCHVMDRERLAALLPLTPQRGPMADAGSEWLNRCLFPLYNARAWVTDEPAAGRRKLADRLVRRLAYRTLPPFPLPPEVLLYEHAREHGWECFYLGDPRAWYIHPDTKPEGFTTLLPEMLAAVREGRHPPAQQGLAGIQFAAWEREISTPT